MMPATVDLVPLGRTDIRVSPVGLGAWQWGDTMMWSYGKGYGEQDVRAAYDAAIAAGINFIDTAEIYGRGQSERLLGQFMDHAQAPVVATKFAPLPWRLSKGKLLDALKASLDRLQMKRVDLYQVHFPLPPMSVETWADGLADAVHGKLARAVGVSNYSVEQMRKAHAVLAKRGVPLATNQVEYSLIERKPERTGLVDVARELGVTIIAYSPLGKGMLTGKYNAQNPPPGTRGRLYRGEKLAKLEPINAALKQIGEAHGGKTPAQVALNWLICKGAVPIPGAKNARQAEQNAGALGWRLSDDEVARLDEMGKAY
jgi:aryl-alcohol dehydrogenase-like predicted oxidoreductase